MPRCTAKTSKGLRCKSSGCNGLDKCLVHIGSGDTCSICLGPTSTNGKSRRLFCGHTFHTECICEWFNTATTCPCCRTEVNFRATVTPDAHEALGEDRIKELEGEFRGAVVYIYMMNPVFYMIHDGNKQWIVRKI